MTDTERRPFDTSLQGLAALYSQHFLAWLKGPGATWQQELNSVIVAQQRRADFLIRYTDPQGCEHLLHVEFQTLTQRGEPREDLPARMVTYALFVLNRYGQVPDQVLILLKDSAATRRVPNRFEQGRMRVEYDVIRLWEQDPGPVLQSGLVGLMPLVPLMGGQELETLLEASAGVIGAGIESETERNEVFAVTGLLASLRDVRTATEFFRRRAMLNLLQETPLFQELTRDVVQQAEQRAEQRGRVEGGLQLLQRQFEHKFGPLPEDLRMALEATTEAEELDRLGLSLLDAPDVETFRRQFRKSEQ